MSFDKAVIVSAIKGGTGKTIFALNLAKRLSERGRTGLIDADVDSSNFAEFTKSEGRIDVDDERKVFKPYLWDGIEVFSVSLLSDQTKPVSMTGDRYVQILRDAIESTEWGKLDFLVVDLPSGAGDIFKETIYLLGDNLVGGFIVIIPSCVVDAKRVIKLHKLNEIPVLGVVENMAWFECPSCGQSYHLFGELKGEQICREFNVPYLGAIPMTPTITEGVKNGRPFLEGELAEPVHRAVEAVVNSKKAGLLSKLRKGISQAIKSEIEKMIAALIVTINRTLDVKSLQMKYGYTEKKPFELIITDSSREKVITRVSLRVDEGKVVVLSGEVKPEYQIVTDISTIARIAWGMRKIGDEYVPYDAFDAWFSGDIRVYGEGTTTRAVQLSRRLFADEVIVQLREKFPVLKRFL